MTRTTIPYKNSHLEVFGVTQVLLKRKHLQFFAKLFAVSIAALSSVILFKQGHKPPTPEAAPMSPLSQVLVRTELWPGVQVWGQDTRDILGQGKVSGIPVRIAPVQVTLREQGEGRRKLLFTF